jgi:hypothetical protein
MPRKTIRLQDGSVTRNSSTDFDRVAEDRWEQILADAKTVRWTDVRAWRTAKALGQAPRRPVPRKVRR